MARTTRGRKRGRESERASERDTEGERARERGNQAFSNAETITFQSAPRHVPQRLLHCRRGRAARRPGYRAGDPLLGTLREKTGRERHLSVMPTWPSPMRRQQHSAGETRQYQTTTVGGVHLDDAGVEPRHSSRGLQPPAVSQVHGATLRMRVSPRRAAVSMQAR